MDTVPIIFIHKGDVKDSIEKQSFLNTTLKCAALFNPNKTINFLGDNSNKKFSLNISSNVKFYNITDYGVNTTEMNIFQKVFRVVKGKQHGYNEWIKFVFQRFFYLYDFLEKQIIDSFWIFDSDTMIITDLKNHEYKYKQYDCTEQCNGMCINGYINTREIIRKYIIYINSLFLDN